MIGLEAVSFGYKSDETIIDDLSWEFATGALTAVTGPSGRGKSTLLYLIGLLLTPWAGVIKFDGDDAGGLSDVKRSGLRASRVGFVFQDAALDASRSVLDNICESALYTHLPRRQAISRAVELMDYFGVGLRADHKPGEVSGGQAQRIALCRALINQPPVILADEPTGNLDVKTASVVLTAFRELADGGNTVIVATHDPTIVTECDEVVEL